MGVIRGVDALPPRKERYEVLTDDVVERADVCVIGSGAGGAVVAHALAKAGRSVVLLERGGYYEGRDMNQRDMDMVPLLWKNGGFNFDDALSIAIAQGACLGGSTVINDAVCFDPPERVKAEWRSLGVDFSDAEWAEHTARVRSTIHVARVTEEELNRNNRMLRAGAQKLGFRDHWPNERNCVNCMQCGFCHNGCHYETKQNMLVTFLHEALSGPGDLRIYCNCAADRLDVRGGRVEGVEGRFLGADGKERYRLRVNARAVVVSAGAIASSHLLLRNRIASETAGRGIVLHPSVLMVGQFPYEIKPNQGIPMAYSIHDFGVNRRQETTRREYDAAGGEFMIESITLPMMEFSMGMPGSPLEHQEFLAKFNHLAIAGMLARDQTRGRVALVDGAEMSFTYEIGLEDRKSLAKASEVVAKMWFALGAEKIATRHPAVPFVQKPEELARLTEAMIHDTARLKLASAHPQSGNAIGSDPAVATVDGDCRVRGIANLLIADASVFPNAVGVNPQLTVMVVASIAAARMVRDWDRRYATGPLSDSAGRTGSPTHPMHFRTEALARAFDAARHAGPAGVLVSPPSPSWSIDPATLEITNERRWRGFLARDAAAPEGAPLFGPGFSREFRIDSGALRGAARAAGDASPVAFEVREQEVGKLGRCLVARYADGPNSKFNEALKTLDDRHVLGRRFEGPPDGGRGVLDFVLVRQYPFELLTPEDHAELFGRGAPPPLASLPGAWEGFLVGEAGPSAPLLHFEYRPDGTKVVNRFRLGKKVDGTAPVASDSRGIGAIQSDGGFWDELRSVDADHLVGILHASGSELHRWMPPGSEWASEGSGVAERTVRFVLERVADPAAIRDETAAAPTS